MRVSAVLVALAGLVACTHGGKSDSSVSAGGPVASAPVATTWLCRPDLPSDACRSADLSATELRPDGSRVVVSHRPAERPRVDCFYVYPTVDLELVPGNHRDFSDVRRMRNTTVAQAARFTEACAVWAPLYHQVTLGTYLQPKPMLERGLAIAFADVERAFAEYLAHGDPTRKIVLIGHSQGGEMVIRLLRRFFEGNAAMRARLLLAMPIGAEVDVAAGRVSGGTFADLPVCTRPNEIGCVVAYRTHAAGEPVDPDRWAPPSGRETVCVDPAALDRDPAAGGGPAAPHRLARAYYGLWPELGRFTHGVSDVTTPFVVVPDFYVARCVRGPGGYAYLEASPQPMAGDPRISPIDLRDRRFRIGKLGLHVLDLQLAQGDLVDMVRRRAAALPDNDERR